MAQFRNHSPKPPIEIERKDERNPDQYGQALRREHDYHHIPLRDQYIELIRNGRKTVEGRINSQTFQVITLGSIIRFYSSNDEVTVLVHGVRRYGSFRAMLEREGIGSMLPGMTSVDEGVELYQSFPRYKEREKEYGVVALHIKVKK